VPDADDAEKYLEASRRGDLRSVQAAVEQSVDLDVVDRDGRTAILLAAIHGHHDVVEHLIDAGADIDRQDNMSVNPFLHGCMVNDLRLVQVMVAAGTDLRRLSRFGGNGITPAAEKGHLEVVQELLETTDINVNHTNWVGWTPLIEAIILNDGGPRQQAIVKLLLDYGASPHLTDKYGVSPLELARGKGYSEIADLLVQAGA
jgi:uncharacterized protein